MGALASSRIRWGILGTGRIASDFAVGLGRLGGAEVAAVASREGRRAEAFARTHGAARAHGSYEALAADPAVDVVYVATPNTSHRDHCRLALNAGKAVLCEKPFATNAREAREVVDLARQRRLFCMEAMWTRCLPLVQRAATLVREGRIGEPLAFQADFAIAVPSRDDPVFRPELGGGALLDLGVYLVAMARLFLGPTQGAEGRALVGPNGVDEQASILLEHSGSRQSLLYVSLLGQGPGEAVLHGTRGRLRLHAPFYRPHRLSIVSWAAGPKAAARRGGAEPAWKEGLRNLYHRFEPFLSPVVRRPALEIFEPVGGNGYHHEAAEVMRCLGAGQTESVCMPLDESLAILETLDFLRARWGVRSAHE